jgi:type I site-specific restriction endonuclease
MSNEAFARVKIDALLASQGWDTQDAYSVRHEVALPDATKADDVLCDRHGRSLAVVEAKRFSISPGDAAAQARALCAAIGRALRLPRQRRRVAVLGVAARGLSACGEDRLQTG